jgi:hypothetical protein
VRESIHASLRRSCREGIVMQLGEALARFVESACRLTIAEAATT